MTMPRERIYDYPVTEYQKAIERLGWSQVHAAKVLGIDPRTSRRYISGDLQMPNTLKMLLRLLVFLQKSDAWVLEKTEKEVK